MQILMSLMLVSQVFLMLVISKAAVKRINEVLDEEPTLVEKVDALKVVSDGSFEFRDVSYSYDNEKNVLNNYNLFIPAGAYVGVFGATGSGKSTFIQLLSRLYDVNHGQVLVGGHDVKDYALEALRKAVVTVLQRNVLFSGTIAENIRFGKPEASDEEVVRALKKACAYEFVESLTDGINAVVEAGGVNFSGGQRQRLCIARALILSPKILILDDSTSAVDTKTDAEIQQNLLDLKEMTKVIISQRLSSIEKCDYIIVLDNNGINQIGNHQSLYGKNEIYTTVYDIQAKGKEV
jgi:ATP-binding cassette subfamily B protein